MRKHFLAMMIAFAAILTSCSSNDGESWLNVFSLNDDLAMGQQFLDGVKSNPAEFNILDSATNKEAYKFIYDIRDQLLSSGEVGHADVFPWRVFILQDTIMNAFCTPGGYIFVYTGIMKKMENKAQLTGVIAHEMAHAALRHSTTQMTKKLGLSTLASIILGENPAAMYKMASDLALGLGDLAFSRQDEYEADEFGVKYMSKGTDMDPRALASFFGIMSAMSGGNQPIPFLSTHPSDEARSAKIIELANKYAPGGGKLYESEYLAFRAKLK